jgi:hypothetical protein
MSDFDPFDRELADAMRRRAGDIDVSDLSTVSAHDVVLARSRGIRRRRAGVVGGVTMLALAAGGFVLLDGGAGDDRIAPATDPTTGVTDATTTVVEPTTVPTTTTPTVPPTTTGAPTTTAGPTTTAAPSTTTPLIATTQPQPPPPTPTTETYESTGGSITVVWDGSALDLTAVNPAAGHEAEVEDDSASRVRVRFRGPAESRIEVRVENGTPVVDID